MNGLQHTGDWDGVRISWALELNSGELVTPERMTERTELSDGGTQWRNGDFAVVCRWRAGDHGGRIGTIEYENAPGVAAVRFPIVVKADFPEAGTLLLPDQYGIILHHPLTHVAVPSEYTCDPYDPEMIAVSEMVTMRGAAMLLPEQSFFFDFRDPTWFQKRCFFRRGPGQGEVMFYGNHLAPQDERSRSWRLPYECGITPFEGGWFEAAQVYRRWALRQPRARKRPDERVRAISCVCWNRGLADQVAPPVLRLSADTGSSAMLSWYWWHHNPYDTDYPDYWPPRDGETVFRETIAELKRHGCHVQVYVNGMTWDMDGAARWPEGPAAIVRRRDGTPECFPYNVFNHHRLGSICGIVQAFQDRLMEQFDRLAAAGLPGIYIDMIGNANHRPCYASNHGHAPGGGDYHYQGYRRMVQELRRRHPQLLLSTEDCGEDFMDLMDLLIGFHICHERFSTDPELEQVPFYPAVYHGVMPIYGSYTLPDGIPPYDPAWPREGRWRHERDWMKLFPDQFFLEMARQIVYGNIPTVANLQLKHCTEERYREVYEYLCRTVRFYREHVPFLFDGEMLAPPEVVCPKKDVDFMARFIYTREEDMKTVRRRLPQVFASRWRSPDGVEAVVAANWSSETVTARINGQSRTIPAHDYACWSENV